MKKKREDMCIDNVHEGEEKLKKVKCPQLSNEIIKLSKYHNKMYR
jgi:hypothetical protein